MKTPRQIRSDFDEIVLQMERLAGRGLTLAGRDDEMTAIWLELLTAQLALAIATISRGDHAAAAKLLDGASNYLAEQATDFTAKMGKILP